MHIDGNGTIDADYSRYIPSSDLDDSYALESPEAGASGSLLGSDAISSSPLTYFGGVVKQIGQAMIGSQANGGDGDADMSKAVELLEGVIGLMSGVDGGDGGLRPLPAPASLPVD